MWRPNIAKQSSGVCAAALLRVLPRCSAVSRLKSRSADQLSLYMPAGEDGETIRPTLSYLAANGIGGILDYAAESDVDAEVRIFRFARIGFRCSRSRGTGVDLIAVVALRLTSSRSHGRAQVKALLCLAEGTGST